MNVDELGKRALYEARGLGRSALARPVRTAAIALGATVLGGSLANGLLTLFSSPLETPGTVISTALTLTMFGLLTWGISALVMGGGVLVLGYALRLVLLGGLARSGFVGHLRRYGLAAGGLLGVLVDLWVAGSFLLTLVFTVGVVAAVLALNGEGRRRKRTRRWLVGHIAEAAKEFDPESGAGWRLRNDAWDGERLVSAEAWYPPAFRASDPNRRAAIERAVMWAMRTEPQVYGLEWPAGARLARIVSEPPLPTRLLDGLWPPAPGIVLGACALLHADIKVRNEAGELIGLRVWNPHAQRDLLVAGVKGSGKTILVRGIIVRGLRAGFFPDGVLVLDGKASGDYASLEGRDGILIVARTPEQWRAALGILITIMQERYEQNYEYEAGRRPDRPVLPRMCLVIDEIQAIIAELGQEAIDFVNGLARMARGANISLVVATQRPDAKDAIPGAIRDQLEDRVAVGYMSPDGGRMMLDTDWRLVVDDDDETGQAATAEKPRGRAVARIAGRLCRIQVPWLDSPVLDPGVELLYPKRPEMAAAASTSTRPTTKPAEPVAVEEPSNSSTDDPPPLRRRRGWSTD